VYAPTVVIRYARCAASPVALGVSVFGYAHQIGYAARNPMAGVMPPPCAPREPHEDAEENPERVFDERAALVLIEWSRGVISGADKAADWAIAVLFGLLIGLRISEAVAVRWSDIDFERGHIHVQRQWNQEKKKFTVLKDRENRHLPLPRTLFLMLGLLKAVHAERPEFDPQNLIVYTRNPGVPRSPSSLRDRFRDIERKLGVTAVDGAVLNFHGLRHTCATFLIRDNRPLPKVSLFLGHSSEKTTYQTYVHLFASDLDDLADTLDRAAGGSPPPPVDLRRVGANSLIAEILGAAEEAAAA
jgi:integrase